MIVVPLTDKVRDALLRMIEAEEQIRQAAEAVSDRVQPYPPARDVVRAASELACNHITALHERLGLKLETRPRSSKDVRREAVFEVEYHSGPISDALIDLYTLLHSTVARYSVIQPVSHRVRDSGTLYETGSTAILTRAHTQEYMTVVGQIAEMLHNAVIWEMDGEENWCTCVCPACGFGICVCSVASRSMLSEAWAEAKPTVAETGLEVQLPRPTSAAARAGFRRGDVLVAVDGEPVNQTSVVQKAIKNHELNDQINFIVRRNGDLVQLKGVRWSDLGVNPEDILDSCVLPAGQGFFTEKAREARDRLSDRIAGDSPLAAGLASLTPREVQVLRLVANGSTNPDIAEELEISRATVARHIANILEKLGAANRAEAASLATLNGLVTSR